MNSWLSFDRIIDELQELSLGMGELEQPLPWQEVKFWEPGEWAPRIVDVVIDAPADIHRYITQQIATQAETGHPSYVRL